MIFYSLIKFNVLFYRTFYRISCNCDRSKKKKQRITQKERDSENILVICTTNNVFLLLFFLYLFSNIYSIKCIKWLTVSMTPWPCFIDLLIGFIFFSTSTIVVVFNNLFAAFFHVHFENRMIFMLFLFRLTNSWFKCVCLK